MNRSGEPIVKSEGNDLLYRYREIFELSPDIIFIHDLDGNILDANQAAVSSTGYSKDELLDLNMRNISLTYPKMYDEVLEKLRNTRYVEFRGSHRRKDGSFYSVEAHVKLVKYRDDEVVIAVDREITEQLQREALNLAQREIREVIASSLDIDAIMKEALIRATQSIGSEAASIILSNGDDWIVRHIFGLPNRLVGSRCVMGERSLMDMVSKRGMVMIDDPQIAASADPCLSSLFKYKSILAAPLITRQGLAGILIFQYRTAPVPFTDLQIDFASDIVVALSLAIDNSRLYQETKKAADRLSQIMNTATEGIMVVDGDGNVTYMNASVERILDVRAEEMMGRKYFEVGLDLTSIDGQPAPTGATMSILDALSSPVRQMELSFVRRDSSPLVIMVNSSPILNDDRFQGSVISFIDITKRKIFEKALNESLVTSRDIVENLPLGLTIYDFDPPDKLVLSIANIGASSILHTDLANKIGKDFDEIWPRSFRPAKDLILRVIKSGKGWRSEKQTIEDKNFGGSYSIRIFPLPGSRVCVAFEDVTQRITEEEVRRKALEQIEKNIEHFAALVDEIRNPLSVISGLNELGRCSNSDRISIQVEAIERILKQLDEGWLQSEKIRTLLRMHI